MMCMRTRKGIYQGGCEQIVAWYEALYDTKYDAVFKKFKLAPCFFSLLSTARAHPLHNHLFTCIRMDSELQLPAAPLVKLQMER